MATATSSFFRTTRHHHRADNGSQELMFRSLATGTSMFPDAAAFVPACADEDAPVKALLVVAHPDDESECAAVIYRITHELGGTVDQVVVTNGEGGHQYAALAEAYYRLPLIQATDGRQLLTHVRREELMRASRILGIRTNYFLDQKDTGPTLDASDGLKAWDVARVRQELRTLLQFEDYNLVLVLLPTADTHGHHQAVANLTLEAVAELDADDRPAIVGVKTANVEAGVPEEYSGPDGYHLARTLTTAPTWSFDRRTSLTCHRSMDYSVIVNWVIAEHKSQGLFQMEYGRRTHEHYWLFEAGGEAGHSRWRQFLRTIDQNSFAEAPKAVVPKAAAQSRAVRAR